MIPPLKELGKIIKANPYEKEKSIENKIKLLAGIFALWVIIKS